MFYHIMAMLGPDWESLLRGTTLGVQSWNLEVALDRMLLVDL